MFDIDNHSKALSVKSVEDELYSNTSYVIDDVTCIDQKFLLSKETHAQGCWIVKGKKYKKFLKFND